MTLLQRSKEQVLEYARGIEEEGLIFGTWGNVSCLMEAEKVVITPSGIDCKILQPDDMVAVNLQGEVVESRWKPSTELLLHLEIYKARNDALAIIHTHSKYATVFAVARKEIAVVTEEMAQMLGGSVPVAQYAMPGSQELAFNAVTALGKRGFAVLLANHGVVCLGKTLAEAFQRCQVLERSAEILLWSRLLGDPCKLTSKEVSKLRKGFMEDYGQDK